ncbi:MAG: hypothetical protein MUP82_03745 [Candidatus Marinimicrobia bacterium]|nr:hypothetical protein [Candidatus Neomarinimicrobiota bacterium]
MSNFNQNKDIKMITNVYMQNYSNAKGGGIGDFFRGSFFLLQFCIKNNLLFDIDYQNHPVSKYLYKKYNRIEEKIDYGNVLYYYPNNEKTTTKFYNDFITYLHSNINKNINLFSNNYPMNKISKFEKIFLRDKFLPNEELVQMIDNKMASLGLLEKKFKVIHIRVDDSIFTNDTIDNTIITNLYNFVDKIFKTNHNSKLLLLSNSNSVKIILKKKIKQLIIDVNKITHLAFSDDNLSIRDTLCDMFLMSKSNEVFSISPYDHGTGFSKYICELYDIPCYPFFIKL